MLAGRRVQDDRCWSLHGSSLLMLVLACLVSLSDCYDSRCPQNVAGDYHTDFREKCYVFHKNERRWASARDACRGSGYGGHMIQILDEATQLFIAGKLIHKNWGNQGTWLGLHDRNNENYFQWDDATGDTPMGSYSNWQPGEPNNRLFGQDCVYMRKSYGYKWVDVKCDHWTRTYYYICEYDKTPVTTVSSVSPNVNTTGIPQDPNIGPGGGVIGDPGTLSGTTKVPSIIVGGPAVIASQTAAATGEHHGFGTAGSVAVAVVGAICLLLLIILILVVLRRRRQNKADSSQVVIVHTRSPNERENPLYGPGPGHDDNEWTISMENSSGAEGGGAMALGANQNRAAGASSADYKLREEKLFQKEAEESDGISRVSNLYVSIDDIMGNPPSYDDVCVGGGDEDDLSALKMAAERAEVSAVAQQAAEHVEVARAAAAVSTATARSRHASNDLGLATNDIDLIVNDIDLRSNRPDLIIRQEVASAADHRSGNQGATNTETGISKVNGGFDGADIFPDDPNDPFATVTVEGAAGVSEEDATYLEPVTVRRQ